MTRRVVLGKYNDGVTIGLRVSLPGVDALTGDSSDPGNFSFDSEWTDIAKIHLVGLSARTTVTNPFNGLPTTGFRTDWTALGYQPFVETRLYSGGVIYDDYFPSTSGPSGSQSFITDSAPNTLYTFGGSSGDSMLTIVYKIALPA